MSVANVQVPIASDPVEPGPKQAFDRIEDAVVCRHCREERTALHEAKNGLSRRSVERLAASVLVEDAVGLGTDRLDLHRCVQLSEYEEAERFEISLLLSGQHLPPP